MRPLALTLSLLYSTLVHKATDNTVLSICFSPDGELLATGAMDGVVQVSSGTFISAIVIVVIIIFEPNAQHKTTSGALDLGCCQEANPQQSPGSHWQDGLFTLSLSWDGRSLVSGSSNCTTKIWDMMDGSLKTLAITDSVGVLVSSVAISSGGRMVAAGSRDAVRDL